MSLVELKSQISDLKSLINKDSGDVPRATRSGFQIRQNQAKSELPELSKQFFDELQKSVVKVFFTGESGKNQLFVKLLSKSVTVFNPVDVYGQVALNCQHTLGYGGAFTSETWRQMLGSIGDVARKFGLVAVKVPTEPSGSSAPTLSDLRRIVKRVIDEAYGFNLAKAVIMEDVFNQAMKSEFSAGVIVVPMFVDDLDERDAINATLFRSKQSMTVTFAPEEFVSQELVDKFVSSIATKKKKTP